MFKYFKLKKKKLEYEVELLSGLCDLLGVVKNLGSSTNELVEMAHTLKGAGMEDILKAFIGSENEVK